MTHSCSVRAPSPVYTAHCLGWTGPHSHESPAAQELTSAQEPVTKLTPGDIKPMLGQVITNINTKMAGLDMDNQVILSHFIRKAIDRSILTSLHVINHGHRAGIIFKSRNENAA